MSPKLFHRESLLGAMAQKHNPTREELTQFPLEHLDLERVKTVRGLVEAMRRTSFQSRTLAMCAAVYENMAEDPSCTIYMGCAGALVPGGMRKVIRDLVENGFVDVLVTTGAIAYHDWYEAHGYRHYLSSPDADDIALRKHWLDRVYDTLADESMFREIDTEVSAIADKMEPRPFSSREFLAHVGQMYPDPNSIVYTCAKNGVPYFVPALNDSSFGIALTKHYMDRRAAKEEPMRIDPIRDNYEITQITAKSAQTGVFYIGGGTPKNYISQTAVIEEVLGMPDKPHMYAAQITTDVPHWGGLSGCTFEESQSWGKFHKNAKMAQSIVDATIGLPLVAGYLMESGIKRKRKTFKWNEDRLVSVR